MAPEDTTQEQGPTGNVGATGPEGAKGDKKPAAKAKKTKLICKGPGEVSIHLIDEGLELNSEDGKIGAGSVKGMILVPGQCVDIDEVPDYQITDEIKAGTHPGLELVTAQEASIYKPIPEGDIVAIGMEVPRNNHMARPVPAPQ